jgi:hypothetical protein
MSQREAIEKLLPYAEAAQEALYKVTLKYPGRDDAQSDYEDCRHAVSFAYEAMEQATKVQIEAALRRALIALNTARCFRVPSLDCSSYEIAAELERAILGVQLC